MMHPKRPRGVLCSSTPMGEPRISQLLEESDRSGVALVCAGREEQDKKISENESCVSHLYTRGYCMTRAGERHVGAPGRLIIWGPGQTNNLAPLTLWSWSWTFTV